LYLAWTFIRRTEEKQEIAALTILLAANLLFYFFYTMSPFGKEIGNSETGISRMITLDFISNFSNLQNGLGLMVSKYVGGLFGNPLMIILSITGVFSIINFKRPLTKFHRILLLWVLIPSLALLSVPSGQEILYYRIVYLMPFQILAALGLNFTFNNIKEIEYKFKLSPTYSQALRILLFTLVVLFLLNYSLRSVDEATVYSLTP
jgi:hypothetical protein